MKALTLVLLAIVVCSSAYLIKVPTTVNNPASPNIAPSGWVRIQKLMLPLFDNVCEDSTNAAVVQLAKEFTLDDSNSDYKKTDVLENLRSLRISKGFLPKGEIFTEYNSDHVNELRALYELFYYAGNFDTFYRAASWARQNVNCGLFVDAIYLAIVNRKDTSKISVPAPYELLPNYFINKDTIVKASMLLTGDEDPSVDVRVEGNAFVLEANYTSEIDDSDEDSKLAYFREDIALNAFYFIRKLRNAPWFNLPNDDNSLYGERMFHMMKQLAARYDLERYSHGLPELEGFSWDSTVTAYDPMLIYSNGQEFEHRKFSGVVSDTEEVTFLRTIENNLATVVTHLRQAGHNKSQILSHLIEILVTSDKSYETLCRKLLGYEKDSTERHYSVLEHYMTTMRDPIFWKINKKMVQLISNAIAVLPSYSRNELYFPGVEVLNIETKKMMTSLENFQFDVTDSLKSDTSNTTFQVKISQPRLNHKPFTMKLNISSLVTKKGFVKIYIGPKMMPGELALKKHLFVLLDLFEVNLKRGINVVSRSSDEMAGFSGDFMSLRTLRKKVEDAEFGLDALSFQTVDSQIGYPTRLMLPKGLPGGLPLQVFVFVAPFTKGVLGGNSIANMELNTAVLSPGYPLDLPIEIRQLFSLPNSLIKEMTVTYKSESAAGSKPSPGGRPGPGGRSFSGGRPGENDWHSGTSYNTAQTDYVANDGGFNEFNVEEVSYDDSLLVHGLLGVRPNFTYKNTDDSKYAASRNQYRNKVDYATKRTNKPFFPKTNTVEDKDVLYEVPPLVTSKTMVYEDAMLSDRPDFTYKKSDSTDYSGKKTQDQKGEDYTSSKTNKYYNTQTFVNVKDSSYTVPSTPIVEEDFSYVDTLVPHHSLGDSNLENFKDTHFFTNKNEYTKKREEYAAKRKQKLADYEMKRELKKEYYNNKREQKKDNNAVKKDKYQKSNCDKSSYNGEVVNDCYDTLTKDDENVGAENNSYDTVDQTFDSKNNYLYNIADSLYDDTLKLHNLLGSKPNFTYKTKGTNVELFSNQFQYKKKKEEFDNKVGVYKKKEYSTKDINKKVSDNSSNEIGKNVVTSNKKDTIHVDIDDSSKTVRKNFVDDKQKTDFVFEGTSNNKEIRKNKDKDPVILRDDDVATSTRATFKNYESKIIHKDITNDELYKNVLVDKNTSTNKYISKNYNKVPIPIIPETEESKAGEIKKEHKTTDGNIVDDQFDENEFNYNKKVVKNNIISSDTVEDHSEEMKFFTILEDFSLTTESPKIKKRVSVYDFLFNPVDYNEEDIKVYE